MQLVNGLKINRLQETCLKIAGINKAVSDTYIMGPEINTKFFISNYMPLQFYQAGIKKRGTEQYPP
jgi:hypothetical protein